MPRDKEDTTLDVGAIQLQGKNCNKEGCVSVIIEMGLYQTKLRKIKKFELKKWNYVIVFHH